MLGKKSQKLILRIVFLPLALLLSLPLSLLLSSPQTVNAATASTSMDAPTLVQSWWYYEAILQCINSGASFNTDLTKIKAGELFNGDGNGPAGYYMEGTLTGIGTDGKTNCNENNSQLTQKAFSLWGLNLLSFLCDAGALNSKNQSCTQATSGDMYYPGGNTSFSGSNGKDSGFAAKLRAYINKQVYGGNSPFSVSIATGQTVTALPTDEQYYFYQTTMVQGCIKADGSLPAALTKNPGGADVYTVKTIVTLNGQATLQTSYYIGNRSPGDGIEAYPSGTNLADPGGGVGGHGNWSLTCKQIEDRASSLAQSAVDALNTAAAKAACVALKYAEPLLSACELGAQNQDKPATFCDNANFAFLSAGSTSNADLIAACKAGQGATVTAKPPVSCAVTPNDPDCVGDSKTTCNINGIGWIVCPILGALAGVDSLMYGLISGILTLNPVTIKDASGNDSAMYTSWQAIKNIGNVVMVIAFLLVIFSQITNLGITNYGIKKILPRIILIAIAINLSFFIMSLIVDVVNILGKGLYDIFTNLAPGINEKVDVVNITGSILSATAGTGAAVAATVGIGAIAATNLPVAGLLLLPFLLGAVLAVFFAFATLFIRNALVIVLIVISPLALAAYILPNTSSWFDRWRKLFTSMLIMYPFAAVLFGGAQFAAYVIISTNPESFIYQIIAIFIIAAPLGALPFLARSSGGIVGQIGGKLQGLAKSARKGAQRGLKPFTDNQREKYRSGRNNVFGRTQADGTRNGAQRWNQNLRNRLADTEVSKTKQEQDWEDRGLSPAGNPGGARGAQNTRRILDAKKTQGQRGRVIDGQYDLRHDERINTAGTIENAYANQSSDTKTEADRLQALEKEHQTARIENNLASTIGGGNLGDLQRDTFEAKENAQASQGVIDRGNEESGVADDARQLQKRSASATRAVQTRQQTAFDQSVLGDTDLSTIAQDQSAAERLGSTATAVNKEAMDIQADYSPELRVAHEQKEAAELGSSVVASGQAAEFEGRKALDGDLFDLNATDAANKASSTTTSKQTAQVFKEAATDSEAPHLDAISDATRATLQAAQLQGRVADGATGAAEAKLQSEYAASVLDDSTGTAVAAAGIGGPGRVPLVEAQAIESQKRDYDSNVSAYTVRHAQQGIGDYSADNPAAESLYNIATDTSRPAEERDAAGRALVSKNNIDAIKPYQNYLASALESAQANVTTATTSGDADQISAANTELETVQNLQKSYGNSVGSSAGRPVGLSAFDIAKFQTGTYTPPAVPAGKDIPSPVALTTSDIQALNTVEEKGISMDNWAAMDKNDIRTITTLTDIGAISPTRMTELRGTIESTLKDPRWSGRIKEREKKLLAELDARLANQGAPVPETPKKGDKKNTSPPTPPPNPSTPLPTPTPPVTPSPATIAQNVTPQPPQTPNIPMGQPIAGTDQADSNLYRTNSVGTPIRPSGTSGNDGAILSSNERTEIDSRANATNAAIQARDQALAAGRTPEEAQKAGEDAYNSTPN